MSKATSLMKLRAITSSFPRKMLRSKLILIVVSLLLIFLLRYSLKPKILFFSRTAKIISYTTNTVKLHRSALLPNFEEKFSRPDQLFFLETSGRPFVNYRQACSIESAAKFSGLNVTVIFVSLFLDLSVKSTRQLVQKFPDVRFFTVDVEAIFEGTPLQPTLTHIAKTSDPTTILSDALRVLLVWKYGGFYSDLDVVVLKSLKEFRNVIGAARDYDGGSIYSANGEFHFQKGHPLLMQLMKNMSRIDLTNKYRNVWGPLHVTMVIREFYSVPGELTKLNASDLTIVPESVFYPVPPVHYDRLFPASRNSSHFHNLLKSSYMVHTFSFLTRNLPVKRDGNSSVYAYLGPDYCPVSFLTDENF